MEFQAKLGKYACSGIASARKLPPPVPQDRRRESRSIFCHNADRIKVKSRVKLLSHEERKA
jgi:hypothetical protein